MVNYIYKLLGINPPRWNKIFRWVEVGEIPPYFIVFHAVIIAPLYIGLYLSAGDFPLFLLWVLIFIVNWWFAVPILREAFLYDLDDEKPATYTLSFQDDLVFTDTYTVFGNYPSLEEAQAAARILIEIKVSSKEWKYSEDYDKLTWMPVNSDKNPSRWIYAGWDFTLLIHKTINP